jgi:hypothetical protein
MFLFRSRKQTKSVLNSDESVYTVWVVFHLPVTRTVAIELERLIGESVAKLAIVARVVVELQHD